MYGSCLREMVVQRLEQGTPPHPIHGKEGLVCFAMDDVPLPFHCVAC